MIGMEDGRKNERTEGLRPGRLKGRKEAMTNKRKEGMILSFVLSDNITAP